jgi:hypothetical protein
MPAEDPAAADGYDDENENKDYYDDDDEVDFAGGDAGDEKEMGADVG